jgi:hypothetical protein
MNARYAVRLKDSKKIVARRKTLSAAVVAMKQRAKTCPAVLEVLEVGNGRLDE